MKAYAMQDAFGIDAFALVERPTATPNDGAARSRANAVSLNYRELMTARRIHPVIDREFPFEQPRDAFQYMQSAAHFGKIVMML